MSFICQALDAIATTCGVLITLCGVAIVAVVTAGVVLYAYITDDRV